MIYDVTAQTALNIKRKQKGEKRHETYKNGIRRACSGPDGNNNVHACICSIGRFG